MIVLVRSTVSVVDDGSISRNVAKYAGGILLWSGGFLDLAGRATLHSNYGSELGGGAVVYDNATMSVGPGVVVTQNHGKAGAGAALRSMSFTIVEGIFEGNVASGSGGGLLGTNGASVSIRGGRISDNSAELSGGGVYLGESPIFDVARGVITGNTAGDESGGIGVYGSESKSRFVQTIVANNHAPGVGGGIRADGDVTLHAGVEISGNSALRGGGIASYGRVFTSSAEAKWIEIEMDFSMPGAQPVESKVAVLDVTSRSPYDLLGRKTIFSAVESAVETKMMCLPTNTRFSFEGYNGVSMGWIGGLATYSLVMDRGSQTGSVTLEVGVHAETLQFDNVREQVDNSVTTLVVVKNNVAAQQGGGLWFADETASYMRNTIIQGNWAMQGAGVYIARLATADISNTTIENNTAAISGGAIYASTLSTMSMQECAVRLNQADQGAGAFLGTSGAVVFTSVTFEENSAVRGGAVALHNTDSPATSFIRSNFYRNTAKYYGASVAVEQAVVGLSRCNFRGNIVSDGDGGVLHTSGSASNIQFFPTDSPLQDDLLGCDHTTVDVITDWSATTATCSPGTFGGTGNTCDFWPQGCELVSSDVVVVLEADECDGCACFGGVLGSESNGERYYTLTKDGETVGIAGARAAAVKVDTYCLEQGTHRIQAIDHRGEGWFQGHMRVVVHGDSDNDAFVVEGITPFSGNASDVVEFTIPAYSSQSLAESNRASGGGAVLFWKDVEPAGTILDGGGNVAAYGNLSATPPASLVRWNNATTLQGSGETIKEPWVFALLDRHRQIATSSAAVAFVRTADDDGAIVANNIAEFVEGFATFDKLQITLYPGNSTTVLVESRLESFDDGYAAVTLDVNLRQCDTNEFVFVDKCSVCPSKEFLDARGTCTECSRGLDCEKKGIDITALETKEGYYRATRSSEIAYRCFPDGACPRGPAIGQGSCRTGHYGQQCSSCTSDFYETASGLCRKCTDQIKNGVFISYTLLSVLVVATIFWFAFSDKGMKMCMSATDAHAGTGANDAVSLVQKMKRSETGESNLDGDGDDEDDDHKARVLFFVKIKSLLTFSQLAASLPGVLGTLLFPTSYLTLLRIASVTNLSFFNLIPTRCLTPDSAKAFYTKSLIATTATPIAFTAFLYSVYRAKTYLHGPMEKRHKIFYTESFLLTAHLVLSATSVAAFQVFICDEFDAGDEGEYRVLRVERTLRCDSFRWKKLALYAALMIAIYPVGVPLLYAVLLFTHSDQLNPKEHTQPLLGAGSASVRRLMTTSFRRTIEQSTAHQLKIHKTRQAKIDEGLFSDIMAFRFLWADYSCSWYWWELVECSRRIFLSAILSTIATGTTTQIMWGFVVSNFFATMCMAFRPFLFRDDNILVTTAQLCTSGSMFIALALKVGVLSRYHSNFFFFAVAFIPITAMFYALRSLFMPALTAVSDKILPRRYRYAKPQSSKRILNVKQQSSNRMFNFKQNAVHPVEAINRGRRRSSCQAIPQLSSVLEDTEQIKKTPVIHLKSAIDGERRSAGRLSDDDNEDDDDSEETDIVEEED